MCGLGEGVAPEISPSENTVSDDFVDGIIPNAILSVLEGAEEDIVLDNKPVVEIVDGEEHQMQSDAPEAVPDKAIGMEDSNGEGLQTDDPAACLQ